MNKIKRSPNSIAKEIARELRSGNKLKKPKIVNDPWLHGYACACGIIAHLLGADEGQRIAREGGFNRENFIKANCEQYDVDKIYPLDRDE